MGKMEVPFANQEGQSTIEQNSRETLVNMFAEIQVSGRRKIIRRQRACLELVQALAGEKRCLERNGTTDYLIVGDKFYTYTGAMLTECGTLDTATGFCSMVFDENGEVAMSDGVKLYHWNGTTFTAPVTQSVVGVLTFLGGFAVYNEPGTGRFWWSGLNDMQTWGGLDFATAEGKPDQLVSVSEGYKQLWLHGETTTEIWALSGGADSPFTPYTVMERGAGAPLSIVNDDNAKFWLGNDWIPYRADGYRPVTISNPAVQARIAALPDSVKATCRSFSYTDGFHKFLTFDFPGFLTLQFNIATSFWNIAQTFGSDGWEAMGSQFSDSGYVLSVGGISRLVRGINKDNGQIVARGGAAPPISEGKAKVLIGAFKLDCEVGRAATGIIPQIMMRRAKDGETFGNERVRSAGQTGEYGRQLVWRNLGIGRVMTVEVMVTDDFEFAILGADIEVEILDG